MAKQVFSHQFEPGPRDPIGQILALGDALGGEPLRIETVEPLCIDHESWPLLCENSAEARLPLPPPLASNSAQVTGCSSRRQRLGGVLKL